MYRFDGDQILRVPALEAFSSWLDHGFGTKGSGGWPPEESRATLKQIHSTKVAVAARTGVLGEGDALVTAEPGLWVAVKTADCIPVLIVDPDKRVVAAVHAGWRGTAGNIVRTTIDTMVSEFHTNPAGLWAAIGPGIRKCCYEVSGEVAAQFAPWLRECRSGGDGPVGGTSRTMLDLTQVNRLQLIDAGVPAAQVWGPVEPEWCTRCEPETLHSFRRDKEESGRMLSAIRIRNSNG